MNPAPSSSRFSWDSVPVAGSPAPRTPAPSTPPVQRPAPARRDPVKPFTPCDAQRAQLIDDLTGEDFSLEELARRHETSVEALSTFIMTDTAVPRALSAGVMRVKLAAVTALAKAVDLLSAMVVNYAYEFRHDLVPPKASTKQMLALEHKRDNARRACALLHRIANINLRPPALQTPTPAPRSTPPAPAPVRASAPVPRIRHALTTSDRLHPTAPSALTANSAFEDCVNLAPRIDQPSPPPDHSATSPPDHSATSLPSPTWPSGHLTTSPSCHFFSGPLALCDVALSAPLAISPSFDSRPARSEFALNSE